MGNILSRVIRLAFMVGAALALVVVWGQAASAAIPSGDSIGTGHTSTTWQGQYYAAAQVMDPMLCQPGTIDTANLVCDHFQLTVQTAGNVTVTITWPSPG